MSYLLTPEANAIKDAVITRYESHPRVKAARAGSKIIDGDRWMEPNTPEMERVYRERRVLDALVSTSAWLKLADPKAQKERLRALCAMSDSELREAFLKCSRQRDALERTHRSRQDAEIEMDRVRQQKYSKTYGQFMAQAEGDPVAAQAAETLELQAA